MNKKLRLIKLTDDFYHVYFSNSQEIGALQKAKDGDFYFYENPDESQGTWSACILREIATLLDKLNN